MLGLHRLWMGLKMKEVTQLDPENLISDSDSDEFEDEGA